MSEFESFGVWICDHTGELLVPAVETGVSLPKSLVMDIFQAYSEIHTSRERLGQITRYASRAPLASLSVSKLDYLRFQIESYFQEAYILKMRIDAFLNLLEKQPLLRRHKEIAKLRCVVSTATNSIVGLRGKHVHKKRLDNQEITGLAALELIATLGKNRKAAQLLTLRYPTVQKKWCEQLKKTNDAINSLLDDVFKKCRQLAEQVIVG